MINYGYCRYGVKCAYKHNHIKNSYGEDAIEDIKNIKAELDVLKNTVKALMSINQTLSIWLGIQFRQRYGQIKDRRLNIFLNIFGLA